jgi:GNAT superfamily N-acetyltransferase
VYKIRPAASPDEDLEAIRLFGNGIYDMPLDKLAEVRTPQGMAALGLRMAKRAGHTVVAEGPRGCIAGAARITPSPMNIVDPETNEIEHWETVAVHPDHRGRGLSLPLRKAALDTSDAVVIKSRIRDDNPKSWHVAEKLGFKPHDRDGVERIYIMRRPHLKKTAGIMDPLIGAGLGAATGVGLGVIPQDDGEDAATRAGDYGITGALTGAGVGLGGLLGSALSSNNLSSPGVGSLAGIGGGLGGFFLGEWLRRKRQLEREARRRTFIAPQFQ